MKIKVIKKIGGVFIPASDIEAKKTNRYKNDELYEVDIKLTRNPDYHRKVFSFLNFCFDQWMHDHSYATEARQFDVFRKHLTVLAGYYHECFDIHGSCEITAQSLSYPSMNQDEFESFYHALINAALKHIFKDMDDERLYNKLVGFF